MTQDRLQCSAWMDQAAGGDDAAFGALALAAQDCLYRFCLAQGLNDADAAEAVQETFLRAYRMRASWRVGRDALSWLYGTALNVVREIRRRRGRRNCQPVELTTLAGGECNRPGSIGQGFDSSDLAEMLDAQARQDMLKEALAALPARQQEAVSCRYLLEMNLQQTAEIMGCAEGTVKAAVFAGLANLRKTMKYTDMPI